MVFYLKLADPPFFNPGYIDIIPGANIMDKVLTPEVKRGHSEQPCAINNTFGWTTTGAYQAQDTNELHTASCSYYS